MIDTRKWFASKMKPRKYGDKQMLEHTNSVGAQARIIERGMSPEEAYRIYYEYIKRDAIN